MLVLRCLVRVINVHTDNTFPKQLLAIVSDLEKNGERVDDHCVRDYCFEVKKLPYHDRDCCCPS